MIPENTTVLLGLSPNPPPPNVQHWPNVPEFLRHLDGDADVQQAVLAIIHQAVRNGNRARVVPRLRVLAVAKCNLSQRGSLAWRAADDLWRLTLACPNRLEQFAASLVETEARP